MYKSIFLRLLTALVGIPFVVGMLYLGSWPFVLLVLALALLCQHEVYRLLEEGGLHPHRIPGLLIGALIVLQAAWRPALYIAVAVVVGVVACFPFYSGLSGREGAQTRVAGPGGVRPDSPGTRRLGATLLGIVYPSTLWAFLIELRFANGLGIDDVSAFYLTLAVFVIVWAADTMAYVAGRLFGRYPLAPAVSPKKTWAGAIGGVFGALAAAVLFQVFVYEITSWGHMLLLGGIAGVLGQLGDLAASQLKRLAGAKDSGSLLPGHGGVLDRFDAMLPAAAAMYLYLRFVTGVF